MCETQKHIYHISMRNVVYLKDTL